MTHIELAELLPNLGFVTQGELLDVTNSLPEGKRENVEDLLTQLCRLRKLTKFQALAIHRGRGKSLIFGNYVIEDKLGIGGFGAVFRGRHRLMNRPVAIKVFDPSKMNQRDVVNRFIREVRAVARLEHPNIVKAYDADQRHGRYYLAMELVEGKVLYDIVKEKGRLPISKVINYICQITDGLDYAHRQGVIHRDIKPGNLIVDSNDRVKILDMGLARLDVPKDAVENQMTEAGTSLGTSDFMAPEQAVDSWKADARSDIYSLGCTMYFLLVADVLFPCRSEAKKIVDHHVTPAPSLRLARPDASPELDRIFQAMVAKAPEERYQSAAEVLAELTALSEEESAGWDSVAVSMTSRVNGPRSRLTNPKSARSDSASQISNGPSFSARQAVPELDALPKSMIARSSGPVSRHSDAAFPLVNSMPGWGPWYEPITRPEFRNYVVGGVVGLLFVVVTGSVFFAGSIKLADAKIASTNTNRVRPANNLTTTVVPSAAADSQPALDSSGSTTNRITKSNAAPRNFLSTSVESSPESPGQSVAVPTAFNSSFSPNQILAMQYSFDNSMNGTTEYTSNRPARIEGNRQYCHIIYAMVDPTKDAPAQLKMREAIDVIGPSGRPGVLQLIGEIVPSGLELALFKLCGDKNEPHFRLPNWKTGAVTIRNLRQTVVQMSHRIVRANPTDDPSQVVSFSLEQNHPANYDARLELDQVHVTGEWKTFTKRLSQAGNVERFVAAMAENPNAGLQLVWSSYKQPFHTGDRIEIAEIKFIHEENVTALSSVE